MIVALRTAGRLAEPCCPNGADAIGQHSLLVIFGLGAPFFGREEQPIEGRADAGLLRCIGQQIAGNLFQREPVESLVFVERSNDPITVRPNIARIVAVITDCVGEANHIEPTDRHPLAIVRVLQNAVNELFVGVGRLVVDEVRHFLWRGWQTQQVEIKAAN